MNYQYSYLIGDSALLIVWVLLFLLRKDLRREMLKISTLFGLIGLIVERIFIIDWWGPLTITNTKIGIEDFIFGFVVGGIASVIYEAIFVKKATPSSFNQKTLLRQIGFLTVGAVLFFGSLVTLKLHSFWYSLIAVGGTTLLIWILRKDLILESLISGIMLSLISFLFYIIPEFSTPGWVPSYWHLENLTGIIILEQPLEDLIWFFSVGLLIGPLYKFFQGRNYKNNIDKLKNS